MPLSGIHKQQLPCCGTPSTHAVWALCIQASQFCLQPCMQPPSLPHHAHKSLRSFNFISAASKLPIASCGYTVLLHAKVFFYLDGVVAVQCWRSAYSQQPKRMSQRKFQLHCQSSAIQECLSSTLCHLQSGRWSPATGGDLQEPQSARTKAC